MANHYEYMNESSIDISLKCNICSDPLINPYSTPCDHTFCHLCITKWIEENDRCPACSKKSITIQGLQPTNLSMFDRFDQLHVQCRMCRQSNILRGNFHEHITKFCAKTVTSCSAADLKCSWQGPRDQSEKHIKQYTYEIMRPLLGNLLDQVQTLSDKVQQNENQIKILEMENTRLKRAIHLFNDSRREQSKSLAMIEGQQRQFKERIELIQILSNPTVNHNQRLDEILSQYGSHSTIILNDLRLNNFDIPFIIHQCLIIKRCSALILSNNSIQSIGIELLSNALRTNVSLKRLSLKGNQIGPKGVEYLSNALMVNETLEILDLEANHISDLSAIQSLAQIIRHNNHLKQLYLGYNQIGNEGMEVLGNAFDDKTTIEILSLMGNQLGDRCLQSIITILNNNNQQLQRLDLYENRFSLQGKTKLLQIGYSKKKGFKLNI